ncbi:hypothetical protein MKEN_00529200 [Mycena kentingensis (nom. inval.)]|nr:hypothetical protein MKEN_00529200 [Mycena kentingensis (nom. inval.)]
MVPAWTTLPEPPTSDSDQDSDGSDDDLNHIPKVRRRKTAPDGPRKRQKTTDTRSATQPPLSTVTAPLPTRPRNGNTRPQPNGSLSSTSVGIRRMQRTNKEKARMGKSLWGDEASEEEAPQASSTNNADGLTSASAPIAKAKPYTRESQRPMGLSTAPFNSKARAAPKHTSSAPVNGKVFKETEIISISDSDDDDPPPRRTSARSAPTEVIVIEDDDEDDDDEVVDVKVAPASPTIPRQSKPAPEVIEILDSDSEPEAPASSTKRAVPDRPLGGEAPEMGAPLDADLPPEMHTHRSESPVPLTTTPVLESNGFVDPNSVRDNAAEDMTPPPSHDAPTIPGLKSLSPSPAQTRPSVECVSIPPSRSPSIFQPEDVGTTSFRISSGSSPPKPRLQTMYTEPLPATSTTSSRSPGFMEHLEEERPRSAGPLSSPAKAPIPPQSLDNFIDLSLEDSPEPQDDAETNGLEYNEYVGFWDDEPQASDEATAPVTASLLLNEPVPPLSPRPGAHPDDGDNEVRELSPDAACEQEIASAELYFLQQDRLERDLRPAGALLGQQQNKRPEPEPLGGQGAQDTVPLDNQQPPQEAAQSPRVPAAASGARRRSYDDADPYYLEYMGDEDESTAGAEPQLAQVQLQDVPFGDLEISSERSESPPRPDSRFSERSVDIPYATESEDDDTRPSSPVSASTDDLNIRHRRKRVVWSSDSDEDEKKHSARRADGANKDAKPPIPDLHGHQVVTWKIFRSDHRHFQHKAYFAEDLDGTMYNYVNSYPPALRNLPAMRVAYETVIHENTADDEPLAPLITIENTVDNVATPPWDFYYTNRIYLGKNVEPSDMSQLIGCDCVGPCDPNSTTCSCLKRQNAYLSMGGYHSGFQYDSKGHIVTPGAPIIECNAHCSCDDECQNRVVQHGRKCDIVLRKTERKGWGVFAKSKISKGSYIGIYSWRVAVRSGMRRERHHDKYGPEGNKDAWIPDFGVDAYHVGNFTRFLNHSCEPNCKISPCYINEPDDRRPLIVLFADKDILAGEEICFSYFGDPEDEQPPPSPSPSVDSEDEGSDENEADSALARQERQKDKERKKKKRIANKCFCGSARCQGKMFNTSSKEPT